MKMEEILCPWCKTAFKKQIYGMKTVNSCFRCGHPLSIDSSYEEQIMIRDRTSKNLLRKFHNLWDNCQPGTDRVWDIKVLSETRMSLLYNSNM
ncbi:hypothetical protein [Methanolobus halotolerans]|uniref:Uncharacterized protein n=1 Tax=Methanolobus halotolerans TaxID=2052935 RepID=A0A4E0QXH8_9EURY|nr:hypothetical protein [Methanolobus halotolerans]TGC07517.1 hypothetical protein CUN85_11060 [Methanolobus halotolerans]